MHSQRRMMMQSIGGGVNPFQDAFIFEVTTDTAGGTSANNQFTVPIEDNGFNAEYDLRTSDGQIFTNQTGQFTITFPAIGSYTIEVVGVFEALKNNGGDLSKITDILAFGNVAWKRFRFSHTSLPTSYSATDIPNLTQCDSVVGMFYKTGITSLDLTGWDFSNVTLVNAMLDNISGGLPLISLTGFDSFVNTANSITVLNEFARSSPLNIDVSNINTSNVTNIRSVLQSSAVDRSLANWDITSVNTFGTFGNITATISTANYDATLIGWEATLQAAFPNGAGYTAPTGTANFKQSKYTIGSTAETARTNLINTFGWNIADGGGI